MTGNRRRTHRAGGQEPPDDRPARHDLGFDLLVGWMDAVADEADQVAAESLALWRGQIHPLEPVLIAFVVAKEHLEKYTKRNVQQRLWLSEHLKKVHKAQCTAAFVVVRAPEKVRKVYNSVCSCQSRPENAGKVQCTHCNMEPGEIRQIRANLQQHYLLHLHRT